MVNSGSFESDVDRNEKGKFTQSRSVAESPHSVSSGPVVNGSLCENDFTTQTADSLPVSQAIEPTATKTEYKCNMSDLLIRSSEILPSPQCVSDNIIKNREKNDTYNGQVTLISDEKCSTKLEKSIVSREVIKTKDIDDDHVEKCNLHKLSNKDEEIKAKVSVCCSVPLDKVQNVLMTYRSTINDSSTNNTQTKKQILKKDMCLYCDRTFLTSSLKQKHVERYHSLKYNRRLSARRQATKHSLTACFFCDKLNDRECSLRQLFVHLVTEHPKKYFGCLDCEIRFPNVQIFKNHIITFHENEKESMIKQHSIDIILSDDNRDVLENRAAEKSVGIYNPIPKKFTDEVQRKPENSTKTNQVSGHSSLSNNLIPDSHKKSESKNVKVKNGCKLKHPVLSEDKKVEDEKGKQLSTNTVALEPIKVNSNTSTVSNENKSSTKDKSEKPKVNWVKELRNKKVAVIGSKIGVKQCLRITRQQSKKQVEEAKSNKKPRTVKNDRNNKTGVSTKYLSFQNRPYSAYDVFRIKKITDHSIDNLRISSLTFDDVFDKTFFNRVKCNIQENLLNHVDGKLFKSIESENRISSFQKSKDLSTDETNQNEVCNSGTSTSGCLLSDTQLGEEVETVSETNSKSTKKKATSNDEVHYKYFTRRKYQAVISENKQQRDLSKLDMWTQLAVKNRQQKILCDQKSDKEILEYKKSDEYKVQMQVEELDKILDKRGPLEDLKEEAMRTVRLEKLNGAVVDTNMESYFDVSVILNELLDNLFTPTPASSSAVVPNEVVKEEYTSSNNCQSKTEISEMNEEIPNILNLRRITQDNSAAKLPDNLSDAALAELTGEWARSRIYVCAACGTKVPNAKSLVDHKNLFHEHVWCQHYEFVGNQGELYRHLSIPGLGKVGQVESSSNKLWRRSEARSCTKCNKQFNCLGDLHRHVLECGGDWSWMLVRKKYKYRPYGSKARKRRRGLLKYLQAFRERKLDKPRDNGKPIKKFDGPRQKPSDADTIQRMLANLPAKRITRKIVCLKDGLQRTIKNRTVTKTNQNTTINQKKQQIKTVTKNSHKTGNSLKKNSSISRRLLRSNSNILLENKGNVMMPKFKKSRKENSKVNLNFKRNSTKNVGKFLSTKLMKKNNITPPETKSEDSQGTITMTSVTPEIGNKSNGIVLNGNRTTRKKSLENKLVSESTLQTLKTKKKLKANVATKKTNSDNSLINEDINKKISKSKKETRESLDEHGVKLKTPKKKMIKSPDSQETKTKTESLEPNLKLNNTINEISNPPVDVKISKRKKRKTSTTFENNISSSAIQATPAKSEKVKDKNMIKKSKIQNTHNAHPPGRRKNNIINKFRNLKAALRKRKPISLRSQITNIIQVDGSSQNKPSARSKNSKNESFHLRFPIDSINLKNFHHLTEEDILKSTENDKVIVNSENVINDKCKVTVSQIMPNLDNTDVINIANKDEMPEMKTTEKIDADETTTENSEKEENNIEKVTSDKDKTPTIVNTNNNAKRGRKPKGLNDCIAMLTNKLQVKTLSCTDAMENNFCDITNKQSGNEFSFSTALEIQPNDLQDNLLPDNNTAEVNLEDMNLKENLDKDINIDNDDEQIDNSSNTSTTLDKRATTPDTSYLWRQLDKNLENKIIIKNTANDTSLKFSIITQKTLLPCLESRIPDVDNLGPTNDQLDNSLKNCLVKEMNKIDEIKNNSDDIPIGDICYKPTALEESNIRHEVFVSNTIESSIEKVKLKKPKVKKHKKKTDEKNKNHKRSSRNKSDSYHDVIIPEVVADDNVKENAGNSSELLNIALETEKLTLNTIEEISTINEQTIILEEGPKHSKHKKQNKDNIVKKEEKKMIPKLVKSSKCIEDKVIIISEDKEAPVETDTNARIDFDDTDDDDDDDMPLAEIVKKNKNDNLAISNLSSIEETQTAVNSIESQSAVIEEHLVNEETLVTCNKEDSNSSIVENANYNVTLKVQTKIRKVRREKLKIVSNPKEVKSKRGRKPKQKKTVDNLNLESHKSDMNKKENLPEIIGIVEEKLTDDRHNTGKKDSELQTSGANNITDVVKDMFDNNNVICSNAITENLVNKPVNQENVDQYDLPICEDEKVLEKEMVVISLVKDTDETGCIVPEKYQDYEESTNTAYTVQNIEAIESEHLENTKEEQVKSNLESANIAKSRHKLKRKLKLKNAKTKNTNEKNSSIMNCHNIINVYCDICNKTFTRNENLLKHKRTLTHIAKLSELEAKVAAAEKSKLQYLTQEEQNEVNLKLSSNEDKLSHIDDKYPSSVDLTNIPLSPSTKNSLKLVDIISDVLSKPIENEFSTNHPNFSDLILPSSDNEIKRCKSLGERKSFESDKLSLYSNTSPSAHHLDQKYIVSKLSTAADLIVEKQISLLENMIEDNHNMKAVSSNHSANDEYSNQSNSSDFSILSTSKAGDCNDITFTHNTNIITNLIKPTLDEDNLMRSSQYEAISEDSSSSHFQIEEQKSRKILNRDEELFLECCSLLKSSSDVSDFCKKPSKPTQFLNGFGLKSFDELEWLEHKTLASKKINDFDSVSSNFVSEDSHINTSTSENFYNNLPYSNPDIPPNYHLSLKTILARNDNETLFSQPPIFEDISRESEDLPVKFTGNYFKANASSVVGISLQDEASDCVSPNVESAQVPEDHSEIIDDDDDVDVIEEVSEMVSVKESPIIIPEDDKEVCKDVVSEKPEEIAKLDLKKSTETDSEFLVPEQRENLSSKTTQSHIVDYVTSKKSKKHHNHIKMLTKGAMKEFEELKVSIPTDGLNMKKILSCSPPSKRLEIEAFEESINADKKSHTEKSEKRNSSFATHSKKSNNKLSLKEIGNKLGLKVTKRKYLSNRKNFKMKIDGGIKDKKPHDVYDFEETQDNMDILQTNSDTFPIYRSFRNKITDDLGICSSKNDNENRQQSKLHEKDGEKISTTELFSTKKINVDNKSITKKKCMIMGRIFKNALKSKIADEIKNIPTIENSKMVENYVMNCPPIDIQHENCSKDHKLSEEEMNVLFDNLLNDGNADNTNNKRIKDNKHDRNEFETTNNPSFTITTAEVKEFEYKSKHKGNKSKKKQRGSSPTSSDEEFSIKVPKRHCTKKNVNNNQCVINLEQELKECIGVASRKSQRKCTSGKQKVLTEHWSSDESNFDAEENVAELIQDVDDNDDNTSFKHIDDATINLVNTSIETNTQVEDKDTVQVVDNAKEESKSSDAPPPNSSTYEHDNIDEIHNFTKKSGSNKRKKSTKSECTDENEEKLIVNVTSEVDTNNTQSIASTRKKRTAVDTLYYWSSSSEDELQDMIEIKSPREEYDDDERPLQHGWIVGNSPKKLVTMLAQAKGKKLEVECVKKNKRKKTGV